MTRKTPRTVLCVSVLFALLMTTSVWAQRQEPRVVAVIENDSMYQVLPPDAIPAIHEPEFVSGTEADAQMRDSEPVLGLVLNNEARAYSLWQLDAHEIVNDVFGETAVAVTWCPLCHTAIVYLRNIGDKTYSFIVSGRLWRNSLVMMDRETKSHWSHVSGEALLGKLKGATLKAIPAMQTTWKSWKTRHPETKVLKKKREITSSRYERYFNDPNRTGIFRTSDLQERLPPKELVYGIALGPHAVAITEAVMDSANTVHYDLGTTLVVMVRAEDGVRSWIAMARKRNLSFNAGDNGTYVDDETGSTWELTEGQCLKGALNGVKLKELNVTIAYWFAWSTYYPNTETID